MSKWIKSKGVYYNLDDYKKMEFWHFCAPDDSYYQITFSAIYKRSKINIVMKNTVNLHDEAGMPMDSFAKYAKEEIEDLFLDFMHSEKCTVFDFDGLLGKVLTDNHLISDYYNL